MVFKWMIYHSRRIEKIYRYNFSETNETMTTHCVMPSASEPIPLKIPLHHCDDVCSAPDKWTPFRLIASIWPWIFHRLKPIKGTFPYLPLSKQPCQTLRVSNMDIPSLTRAHELLHRVEEHMTDWDIDTTDETENETLRTMCEDMRNTCSSVWEMLNKILSENEDDVSTPWVTSCCISYFYPSGITWDSCRRSEANHKQTSPANFGLYGQCLGPPFHLPSF